MKFRSALLAVLVSICFSGCSRPQPGPDKTIAGAVLGAGWGAGTGAVVGNQLTGSPVGEGAAIGAGFGLVSGAMSGYNFDELEAVQIEQERELTALKVQNAANSQQLAQIQGKLDRADLGATPGVIHVVYFDPDSTEIRAGAADNLDAIVQSLLSSASANQLEVVGHSDDAGTKEYNDKLAQARASRVAGYLGAKGFGMDRIEIKSFGAELPIATNSTPVGRQLNRRVDIRLVR